MNFLFYLCMFVFTSTGTYANQKYARSLKSYAELFIYALITGCVASLFFYAISGFCIRLNGETFLYGALFAFVVICGYFFSLPVYRFMGVAEEGFFSSTLNLTLSYVFGMLIFDENIDVRAILRFSVMLVCAFLMYLATKKKLDSENSVTPKGVLLCIGNAMVGVMATVISKSFAKNVQVTDENSFFLYHKRVYMCFFDFGGACYK